jgi:hypothetical protein
MPELPRRVAPVMTGVDVEVDPGAWNAGYDAQGMLDALGAEFPTLMVDVYEPLRVGRPLTRSRTGAAPTLAAEEDMRRLVVSTAEIRAGAREVEELDARVRGMALRGPFTFALLTRTEDLPLCEGIVTRYQRFIARRNIHSRVPVFERVLAKHRRLFALDQPFALAEYEHARDTWHWVLRLDREASLALQLAALFHDVDRLAVDPRDWVNEHEGEVDREVDPSAHARASAMMALESLDGIGLEEETLARVVRLVEAHEQRSEEGEECVLGDADALSTLSQMKPGALDGPRAVHARRRLESALSRMRPSSRAWMDRIWLSPDVRARLTEVV